MKWRVEFAPDVEREVKAAADWYDDRQPGLGARFTEEIIGVWDELVTNPLLGCRRHPTKNIHWRYPKHFPYRIIYEVDEAQQVVRVATVLHAARQERHWQQRIN